MRRRWVVRLAGSVVTGAVAIALLLAWGAVLVATTVADAPGLPGATAAGVAFAIALLPATARYPRGVLRCATRVAIGVGFAIGAIGFAGYAGASFLPDPLPLSATGLTLLVALPTAYERGWRAVTDPRTLLAGDDPATVRAATARIDPPPVGYCAPAATGTRLVDGTTAPRARRAAEADRAAGAEPAAPVPSSRPASDDGHPDGGSVRPSGGGDVERSDGERTRQRPGPQSSASETRLLPASAALPDADAGRDRDLPTPAAERVGGLTDLDRVVRDRGVDAVALRFADADREGFFGALRVCRAQGVDAFAPRSRADSVLQAGECSAAYDGRAPLESGGRAPGERRSESGRLAPIAVDIDPLPWHSRVAKRGFDLVFATIGIVALSPLMTAIAVAIRLDSPGPVLYGQRRTGRLGEPFQLLKFRSMVSDAEAGSGPRLSDEDAGDVDPRVTRVGRVLRATHLDELPQLFSILVGEMSVVGPRPERPAIDDEIAAEDGAWTQRWFLTPGLTGIAQINDVTGFQPRAKLAYDLEYAERQSLALDVRVVAIQLGQVARDVVELVGRRVPIVADGRRPERGDDE